MTTPTETTSAPLGAILGLLKTICETPAPTFKEARRAALITSLWREAGLTPHTDEVGNVIATVPGGVGPHVLVAAHLDTVFEQGIDTTVRQEGELLRAPGIGDNSASLALLSYLVHALPPAYPRLTIAATVGEEGLGDLRGARQLLRRSNQQNNQQNNQQTGVDLFVALDGHLGTVVNASVGARRYRIGFRAKGGHSWGDYPSPSAVHALGSAIHALGKMTLPREPRTSYNVGLVSGGSSINAIAEQACCYLDLRSVDADALKTLEQDALARVKRAAKQQGAQCELELVGDRPTGTTPNESLVAAARDALEHAGVRIRLAASSTDANVAMAAGLPAIAFGVYRGGDAHRLSEWLEPASLETGHRALTRLLANLSRL